MTSVIFTLGAAVEICGLVVLAIVLAAVLTCGWLNFISPYQASLKRFRLTNDAAHWAFIGIGLFVAGASIASLTMS